MANKGQFDETTQSVAALGRDELKRRIKKMRGRFRLDFTGDYLDSLPVDRLRHIYLAALVNAKKSGPLPANFRKFSNERGKK